MVPQLATRCLVLHQCVAPLLTLISRLYVATGQMMPAIFILGDSLTDVGNNNYILTLAKANFPPNGLDFQSGPTGRFCNGRTVPDVIVQEMSLPFPPAYLAPTTRGPRILQGVNYASAAAGILDSSGFNLVGRIPLNQQLENLANTRSQFVQLVGAAGTEQLFRKALFYVTIGSNDYINNYLVEGSATSRQYTPQQYQDLLVSTFSQQLTNLYSLGARKIFIVSVGPLGCIPSQLYQQKSPDGSCIEFLNSYVRGFNAAVRPLLRQLTSSLPGSIYVYGNAYDLVASYVANPAAVGLSVVNKGCCGAGPYNGLIPCIPTIIPCPDRSMYLFWDPFHPTDYTNVLLANSFVSGGPNVVEPINLQQLAALEPAKHRE